MRSISLYTKNEKSQSDGIFSHEIFSKVWNENPKIPGFKGNPKKFPENEKKIKIGVIYCFFDIFLFTNMKSFNL